MSELIVEPSCVKFRPPYPQISTSSHTIHNDTKEYVVFKAKSSSNQTLRVCPVFGVIHPKGKHKMMIRCLRDRAPENDTEDKIQINLKALSSTEAEACLQTPSSIKNYFEDEKVHGFLEIFIIAKAEARPIQNSRTDSRTQRKTSSKSTSREQLRKSSRKQSKDDGRQRRRHKSGGHIDRRHSKERSRRRKQSKQSLFPMFRRRTQSEPPAARR